VLHIISGTLNFVLDLWAVNMKFYILVSSDIKLIISNKSKHNILINGCFTHPDYKWDYLNAAYVVICWNLIFKSELLCIFILCCCWLCRFSDFHMKETDFLEGKGNWRSSALVGKFTSLTNNFCFLKCLDPLSLVYWFCRVLWKSCIKQICFIYFEMWFGSCHSSHN